MSLNIYEYKSNYNLTLCKINKEPVGVIIEDYISSIDRYIDDVDKIELSIPKMIVDRFTFKTIKNPLYYDAKEERLLCLNNKEYFVIKQNKSNSSSNFYKTLTAYSLEYKLSKIDINVEDISFQLIDGDKEHDIYSLNDYLYEETGWKLGYIDEVVRFDIDENNKKVDKLRVQTNVNKSWYDFLKNDITVQFGCILEFDTLNKLINLYDVETKGEDVQIYLTKDNYINDLEREYSSTDIVTRMFVKGNDEMDIISATPTGYNFIENYSYFIQNGEMNKDLEDALSKYYQMVENRTPIWKELTKQKQNKISILNDKKIELYQVYSKINAYKREIKVYAENEDEEHRLEAESKFTKQNDIKVKLEVETRMLDNEIKNLQSSIDNINTLCQYPTATDENGKLIFTESMLNELKDYIYQETYSNDSFLKVEDLINAAKRELKFKCTPTKTYSIDVMDFSKRMISNGFRLDFNGVISLGNIVILVDPDTNEEIQQFIVSYSLKPNQNSGLKIEISDKKIRNDYTRTIADYLNDAKRTSESLNTKQYLLNKVKYNKLNLD